MRIVCINNLFDCHKRDWTVCIFTKREIRDMYSGNDVLQVIQVIQVK